MHYDSRPLGHAKLETTALYAQVATNTLGKVMSPLDCLTPLMAKEDKAKEDKPEGAPPA